MALSCPNCRRQLDSTLFQFGREVLCLCGNLLKEEEMNRETAPPPALEVRIVSREWLKRTRQRKLGRMADEICLLIINSDYPRVDIDIRVEQVRAACEELFPDRMELFEMVYRSRFERLWTQFREPAAVGEEGK